LRFGREHWYTGFGRRLAFKRSWAQIPAHDTGWTFFTLNCKNCKVHLKRPKINKKEPWNGTSRWQWSVSKRRFVAKSYLQRYAKSKTKIDQR